MSDETPDETGWASWRRTERARLIAARLAVPAAARSEYARCIATGLDGLLPEVDGLIVAAYWPIRGEPDLRDWIGSIRRRGARCALPVVSTRGAPLLFREWRADARLVPGVWNIPQPPDGEALVPQVLIVPLVGYDRHGYRLGYGGGYYDRTLAACSPRPVAIGVGYRVAALHDFAPQPHDVPMDAIVDEHGTSLHGRRLPIVLPTPGVGRENP